MINIQYLKNYCQDLIKAATELDSNNESLIKSLNSTFLDIANGNVAYTILIRRLKHFETEIINARYEKLMSNQKLSKRAIIISDNENDSIYFNKIFNNFTILTISIQKDELQKDEPLNTSTIKSFVDVPKSLDDELIKSQHNELLSNITDEKLKAIENSLSYVVNGDICFIYSTIAINVPKINSKYSIVVSNCKLNFDNKPNVEIYTNIPLIESKNAVSKLLFISCSAIYQNTLDISTIKSLCDCNILIDGNETDKNKLTLTISIKP